MLIKVRGILVDVRVGALGKYGWRVNGVLVEDGFPSVAQAVLHAEEWLAIYWPVEQKGGADE